MNTGKIEEVVYLVMTTNASKESALFLSKQLMSSQQTSKEEIKRMESVVRITCAADTIHHLIRLPAMNDLTDDQLLAISNRLYDVYIDLLSLLNSQVDY